MGSNIMQARRSVASPARDGQSGLNKTRKRNSWARVKFWRHGTRSGRADACNFFEQSWLDFV
jgi:hypothetical protein